MKRVFVAAAPQSAANFSHRARRLPAGTPLPLAIARRVPVTWQNSAWNAPVIVPVRKARLKPHEISVTHRASQFTLQVSRNQKHILRRISL